MHRYAVQSIGLTALMPYPAHIDNIFPVCHYVMAKKCCVIALSDALRCLDKTGEIEVCCPGRVLSHLCGDASRSDHLEVHVLFISPIPFYSREVIFYAAMYMHIGITTI